MRFVIELVSAKPDMVIPVPRPSGPMGILPILDMECPPGSMISGSYTVTTNGEVYAGQYRGNDWAYEFTLWAHNDYYVERLDKKVTGNLIEAVAWNPNYQKSYENSVLVKQYMG